MYWGVLILISLAGYIAGLPNPSMQSNLLQHSTSLMWNGRIQLRLTRSANSCLRHSYLPVSLKFIYICYTHTLFVRTDNCCYIDGLVYWAMLCRECWICWRYPNIWRAQCSFEVSWLPCGQPFISRFQRQEWGWWLSKKFIEAVNNGYCGCKYIYHYAFFLFDDGKFIVGGAFRCTSIGTSLNSFAVWISWFSAIY